MEEIILKAIEGGWNYKGEKGLLEPRKDNFLYWVSGGMIWEINIYETVLDPLFWQALGKACGWGRLAKIDLEYALIADVDVKWFRMSEESSLPAKIERANTKNRMKYEIEKSIKLIEDKNWKYYALKFHEINLTEGFEKAVAYVKETTRGTALVN